MRKVSNYHNCYILVGQNKKSSLYYPVAAFQQKFSTLFGANQFEIFSLSTVLGLVKFDSIDFIIVIDSILCNIL